MASKMGSTEDIVTYVTKGIEDRDSTVIGILVAVAVVLLTIVLLAIRSRSGIKRQGILLMGICDSGKTLLFSRLIYKKYKQSVTSLDVNSGSLYLPQTKKNVPVTDIPGHERLRAQTLEANKGLARGLIFVVDSETALKEIKEVAEYLYTILTDSVISHNAPPVLIACNKQDLIKSKGANIIQKALEKEINTLRVTQSAALQSTDNVGNNNTFLGKRDKDFSFTDVRPLRIEFAEVSARGKDESSDADLDAVMDWVVKVA